MKLSTTMAKWIALALLGLAISAGVAVAASNLVSRQIGIASESVSAGEDLAPAVESAARTNAGEGDGPGNTGPEGIPGSDDDDGAVSGGGSEDDDGGSGVGEDELEDRIDEEEDARDDAEDAAEDRQKELEDLADDNSGKGSDD